MTVQPISETQRSLVVRATHACLLNAEAIYRRSFGVIPVRFDLRGRAAGMYRVQPGTRLIRYNPYIFAKHFDEGLAQTVPHEVAHYVTDVLYGLRNVRPHGPEWRAVAAVLGAEPRATRCLDLTGIPQRRHSSFGYRCACTRHELGARRHNKVRRGEGVYLCRRCSAPLVYCGAESRSKSECVSGRAIR